MTVSYMAQSSYSMIGDLETLNWRNRPAVDHEYLISRHAQS
jgi:hypothetical protein